MDVLNLFQKTSEPENYTAELYLTPSSGFKTTDFVTKRVNSTPGNVGICLSGGGSRALSAAMGQLRAMKFLTNGSSNLLSQTKAISTVSGGSWLGVTFEYLNGSKTSDDDYLNHYVNDPGRLVPSKASEQIMAETLDQLPAGNAGENITSDFSLIDIALQAFWLNKFHGTPANMLWQTVIANKLLKPYKLYSPGDSESPTTYYSYDETSIDKIKNLPNQNASFDALSGHVLANETGRVERPFLICNTAMFVNGAKTDLDVSDDFQFLAPVQCTPFFTGIIGNPGGTDNNGKKPGGGGVSSFSFNSKLIHTNVNNEQNCIEISENRPFSLLDSVGSSSAAFAEKLENIFKDWENNFDTYLKAIEEKGDKVKIFLHDHLQSKELTALKNLIEKVKSTKVISNTRRELHKKLAKLGLSHNMLKADIHEFNLKEVIPQYDYWPVINATPEKNIKPTRFADGGNLENSGVAAMLSYQDIDNVISFINSPTALAPTNDESRLQVDKSSLEISTNIEVDSTIPPLYGYQPFKKNTGNSCGTYKVYKGDRNPESPVTSNSQIFPTEKFAELLNGLWGATGDGEDKPAIFKQNIEVLKNDWFGVKARTSVNIVWCYTNWVNQWVEQLTDDVKALLPDDFPHYATSDTELTATQINLLANMTAWSVADKSNCDVFVELYQ